jgi:hypothetical protein
MPEQFDILVEQFDDLVETPLLLFGAAGETLANRFFPSEQPLAQALLS